MQRSRVSWLTGALLALSFVARGTGIPAADDLQAVTVSDLEGQAVQPLAARDAATRGVVFVFTRSDCPIANRYAPDLERLQKQAAAASVEFWLVFVDPAESAATIRDHLRAYGYTGRALRDPRHDLVRAAGATIAPEAAVYVRDRRAPRLVYRGRIDDRYQAPGRMRPAARTHDLEDVIGEVRDARARVFRETRAVGCVIADLR